jgi:hypothetical protein
MKSKLNPNMSSENKTAKARIIRKKSAIKRCFNIPHVRYLSQSTNKEVFNNLKIKNENQIIIDNCLQAPTTSRKTNSKDGRL